MDGVSQLTISAWMKRLASNDNCSIEKSTDNNDRIGLKLASDGNLYFLMAQVVA